MPGARKCQVLIQLQVTKKDLTGPTFLEMDNYRSYATDRHRVPGAVAGSSWERLERRSRNHKTRAKLHRLNGPCIFLRAHNPKAVSSNLTPATKKSWPSITSANPATIRIDDEVPDPNRL